MTRHCKCEKWEPGFKAVDDPIALQSIRSGGRYQFDQDYVFLFCPWCGVRLITDCHTCGIPANTHTGNTLYWYEDKDFCSAACAKKLDMSFAKKET